MGICASQLASTAFARVYVLDEKVVLAERPFAVIHRGTHRASGEPVAIKRIQKAPQNQTHASDWQSEIAILRHLSARHPNVIEVREVFETRTEVLVVMEFVAGGELFDALISDGAYSEWDARRLIKDTLEALKFLHKHNVVHRDIKPENLLFTSRDSKAATIKVVNFALAKLADQRLAAVTNEQLTWPYCAPEILTTVDSFSSIVEGIRRRKSSLVDSQTSSVDGVQSASETSSPATSSPAEIGVKCDLWSVGIVLYVLLSGTHPFDLDGRQTKDQIVQNIFVGTFTMNEDSAIWSSISKEAKSLLTMLLQTDPEKRPSAAQALAHEWFVSPHTPRHPLSVSVSEGLGNYQRLMRKKFRTSVLVTMAAETFRRSLKKQREDTEARRQSAANAPSPGSGDPPVESPGRRNEPEQQGISTKDPESHHEDVRPVEAVATEAGVSALGTQGSVMSRVFQKQTSSEMQDGDEVPVDTQEITLEGTEEAEQISSQMMSY